MVSSGPFVCRKSAETSLAVSFVAALDTLTMAKKAARPRARQGIFRFTTIIPVIKIADSIGISKYKRTTNFSWKALSLFLCSTDFSGRNFPRDFSGKRVGVQFETATGFGQREFALAKLDKF
jgi:hypothetical protein